MTDTCPHCGAVLRPALAQPSPEEIMRAVEGLLSIPRKMIDRSKFSQAVHARRLFVGAMREFTYFSFPDIGRILGHRHHTTVMDSYHRWMQESAYERKKQLKELTAWITHHRGQPQDQPQPPVLDDASPLLPKTKRLANAVKPQQQRNEARKPRRFAGSQIWQAMGDA